MSASHLIVFLHGIGASGQQLAPLASSWSARLPTAVFATPDAPYPNGYGGHQWFKVDGMQLDPGRIREAREGFDRKIRDVITQKGFGDRVHDVAFVGVSQGASWLWMASRLAVGAWALWSRSRAFCLPHPPCQKATGPLCFLYMVPRTALYRMLLLRWRPDSYERPGSPWNWRSSLESMSGADTAARFQNALSC